MPRLEKQTCDVAGHRMAYTRTGSGEPVLLVHGITTYSFIWRRIIPQLSEKYDVIAVDLLGCGDSDMPLDISYAIKDHATYLREFTTALGLERFHFVGHDLGGGMGQIYATRHPEQLYDLTLLNSVAYDFWPVQPITAMRTPIVRQLLMATLDKGLFKLVVKRGIHHAEMVTPELMELFMAPFADEAGRQAFLHFASCLDNSDLTEIAGDLAHLDLPVLIVRGDRDPYLSGAIARKLHGEIPGSRLTLLDDCSHFLQEDNPIAVGRTILEFLGREAAEA